MTSLAHQMDLHGQAAKQIAKNTAKLAGLGPKDPYPTEPVVVVSVIAADRVMVLPIPAGDPLYQAIVRQSDAMIPGGDD